MLVFPPTSDICFTSEFISATFVCKLLEFSEIFNNEVYTAVSSAWALEKLNMNICPYFYTDFITEEYLPMLTVQLQCLIFSAIVLIWNCC